MEQIITPTNDTIVAPATSPQEAALSIMRLSGPDAIKIVDKIWHGKPLELVTSHTAHLGTITDTKGNFLDQAVATVYLQPNSFTGQNCIEITTHGSIYIRRQLLQTLIENGARLANPGEFTQRAFLNGKLDLAQAEAITDIIAAKTKAAHNIAAKQLKGEFSNQIDKLRDNLIELASLLELELDFSEEDVEFASRTKLTDTAFTIKSQLSRLLNTFKAGNAIKNGIKITIAGKTNAGKSTLLNQILGHDRAIVSDIHGTTRDTINEQIIISDHLFVVTDTAGIRNTDDPIEQLGIQRTLQSIQNAEIILYVIDATRPVPSDELTHLIQQTENSSQQLIILLNKTDIPDALTPTQLTPALSSIPVIPISAKNGDGIDPLTHQLLQYAERLDTDTGDIIVANQRHATALQQAVDEISTVLDSLTRHQTTDIIAQNLRRAIHCLSAITGNITTDDLLSTIFSRFCIGK